MAIVAFWPRRVHRGRSIAGHHHAIRARSSREAGRAALDFTQSIHQRARQGFGSVEVTLRAGVSGSRVVSASFEPARKASTVADRLTHACSPGTKSRSRDDALCDRSLEVGRTERERCDRSLATGLPVTRRCDRSLARPSDSARGVRRSDAPRCAHARGQVRRPNRPRRAENRARQQSIAARALAHAHQRAPSDRPSSGHGRGRAQATAATGTERWWARPVCYDVHMGRRFRVAFVLGVTAMALQLPAACTDDWCPPRESFSVSSEILESDVEYILTHGPQSHFNLYSWAEGIPCEDYCIHLGPRPAESYESWEVETCVFDIDGYELGPIGPNEEVVGSVECSGTWQPRCPY
jgi:hypothetical protein